jgi:exodeoxyribonuclease VII large subunit
VQGDEAVRDIQRALDLASRYPALDVLIVGRGGGSKDDLHAFNDEAVARAVAASPVPTISAVGHEVDITLTDMVADLRAATPSAAAEKAVPDMRDVLERLGSLGARVAHGTERCVTEASLRLSRTGERMGALASRRVHLASQRLASAAHRIEAACVARFERARASADRSAASLDALSPLKVLSRGYSMARDDQGRVLKRVADFQPGQQFMLRVSDGDVAAMTENRGPRTDGR